MNDFKNLARNYIHEALPQALAPNKDHYLSLRQEMIATLDELFNQLPKEVTTKPDHLTSQQITLEVVDQDTGQVFRRALPLDYLENDNGLKLSGEDLAGHPTEIVFYSQKASEKINDLTGKGLNQSRCEH